MVPMSMLKCGSSWRRTALHDAAEKNSHESIRVLLSHGGDVNAKNKYGIPALHVAAGNDSHESIRVLLSHGADVNAKSDLGIVAGLPCMMRRGRIRLSQ